MKLRQKLLLILEKISKFLIVFFFSYTVLVLLYTFFGNVSVKFDFYHFVTGLNEDRKESIISSTKLLFTEVFISFIIANITSFILGFLIVEKFVKSRDWVLTFGVILKATPLIVAFPIIYQFIPYDFVANNPGLLGGVLIAFFPTLIETIRGLDTMPRDTIKYYEKVVKLPKFKMYLIKLRFALSHIFPALKISIVLCVVGSIVGELLISPPNSMGYIIARANNQSFIELYFISLFICGFCGVFLYAIIESFENLINWWEIKK